MHPMLGLWLWMLVLSPLPIRSVKTDVFGFAPKSG
jgi:hypothetical protein